MIEIKIPGVGLLRLKNLLLDYNGTVGLDGKLLPGVKTRLDQLRKHLTIYIISADTQRTLKRLSRTWSTTFQIIAINPGQEDLQKLQFLKRLGSSRTVMIGNGANDARALRAAALGVGVIGKEGAFPQALVNADLVVRDIRDALDLFLYPRRLIASLRR